MVKGFQARTSITCSGKPEACSNKKLRKSEAFFIHKYPPIGTNPNHGLRSFKIFLKKGEIG
jgi:hypothetical protein